MVLSQEPSQSTFISFGISHNVTDVLVRWFYNKHFYISFFLIDVLFQCGGGAGSMGCGSSYDYRSSTEHSAAEHSSPSSMMCDMCANKFTLITRKKTCCECGNYFCSTCLPRESGRTRTCSRCRVLNKMPPHRGDLMKLRVKDLQHFLTRKRINIKSCVGKTDSISSDWWEINRLGYVSWFIPAWIKICENLVLLSFVYIFKLWLSEYCQK